MYWFIAALVIASAVFFFAPASHKVTAEVNSDASASTNPGLLLLSLCVTLWLLLTQITPEKLLPASLVLGCLALSAILTVPVLRRFMLPGVIVTALLLLANLLQML